MTPAIAIKNLSFSYDTIPVLERVEGVIHKGETVLFIGPNGGGKTTLLRLLMGFLEPAGGEILVEGKKPFDIRPKMAYVPQFVKSDKEFPISVIELVLQGFLNKLSFWGRYSKEEIKKAEEMLERLGISSFRNAAFGDLSGGQAQKALLARALVNHPEYLFLDEPTASVDREAEESIVTLLKDLKGKCTQVVICHDFEVALKLADRVLCVQREAVWIEKEALCSHFAWGLYHPPITAIKERSWKSPS